MFDKVLFGNQAICAGVKISCQAFSNCKNWSIKCCLYI